MNSPSPFRALSLIGKSAGFRLAGVGGANLLFLVTALAITRFTGAAGLGNFTLAITVFNFLGIVAVLGLKQGAVRYVAYYRGREDPGRVKGTVRTSLLISLLGSAVLGVMLFAFAGRLAEDFFSKPELRGIFRVFGLGLPFFSLTTILLALLQGFKAIRQQVWAENIIRPAGALGLLLAILVTGGGLAAVGAGWAVSYLGVGALAWFWLKRIIPAGPAIAGRREAALLLGFSLPLLLVSLMHRLLGNMDVVMLGYFQPASEVGIYGLAARLALLIPIPLEAINLIFAPMIAEYSGRGEQDKLGRLYRTSTRWINLAAAPGFFLLVVLAPSLMDLFGRDFQRSLTPLIILGVGQLINTGVGSAGFLLAMTGRPRINLYNTAALCLLNFFLNLIMIPRYGIIGAAAATSVSWALINLVQLVEVKVILGFHPFDRHYPLPWIGLLAGGAAALGAGRLLPAGLDPAAARITIGLIFLLLYALILLLLGGGTEERLFLSRLRCSLKKKNNRE